MAKCHDWPLCGCGCGDAQVIQLPKRKCFDCEHFYTTEDDEGLIASHCFLWDEPIEDEQVADECPDYDPTERIAP